MITIPTGDLVGILSDAIPFAGRDEDLPDINVVRLEWAGKQLHALSTDRYRIGWATWEPDDQPEQEHQPDLFTDWGGADEPWQASIALDDAQHLVKTYKLGTKEYYVPLTVEFVSPGAVRVQRAKDTGHSAISTVVQDTGAQFPKVQVLLAQKDTVEASTGFCFNAKYLADFAKVRARGPLVMRFTGPDSLVHVTIGERFAGAIMPVRTDA